MANTKLPPTPVGVPPGHSFWNDWYERLRNIVNSTLVNHNDLQNIQGGGSTERYHLTAGQHTDLTDGGDSTSHFHASDRARANHTGTQTLSTISDVTITAANLNSLDDGVDSTLHFHASDRARATHTGTQDHNTTLSGFQGGSASERFHLTSAEHTGTGTGNFVRQTSPSLTTPNIGAPSAGTLTNCTGLPISTGVSGLGTGVATFLGTPSSANLASAVTDETGSGALVFGTSPTLTTPKATTTIGVGNTTPAASGAGLSFPATQSASSDANTLDDYEEGTFTPTIAGLTTAGVGTYTEQVGIYTKVGNVVIFQIAIAWTAHTGTGAMKLTGLPFTVASSPGNQAVTVRPESITVTANNYMACMAQGGTTDIQLAQIATGTLAGDLIPIDTSATLWVSGSYRV